MFLFPFFFFEQPMTIIWMKKIRYQGIARHLSFWWVWGFSFWWFVSYSICCGVLKPFYSAYALLTCCKYKNSLVDIWVNISLAALRHLLKRFYQYWVCFTTIGIQSQVLGTACQGWTLQHRLRITLFKCVPRKKKAASKLMKRYMEVQWAKEK